MLKEMGQTVPKEFDFVREARLQAALQARLAPVGRAARVVIPTPRLDLTSRTVLVMQRLHGVSVAAVVRDAVAARAAGGGDGGAGSAAASATLAAARSGVEALLAAYGHMIFVGGLMHADPHPGNLLVLTDADGLPTGDLGLLDFGQVKALSADRRRLLASLIIAIDDGDPDGVAAGLAAMGLCPAPGEAGAPDPLLAAVLAAVVFDTAPLPAAAVNPLDETGKSVLKVGEGGGGGEAAGAAATATRRPHPPPPPQMVPLADFPSDLFQIGRTIMLLRGLTHALGVTASSASLWRPHAEAALRESPAVAAAKAAVNKALDNGDDHVDEDA